ncbi:MAG TPA: hypothetical protein VI462_02255 [Acidimicrobiia bacterium]
MTERPPDQPGWAAPGPPPPPPAGGGWIPDLTVPSDATRGYAAPPVVVGQPPRRRRGWLVVLLSVLGFTLACLIVGTVLFVTRTLPPYNGAHDFLNDLNHGNSDAATSRLCDADTSDPTTAIQNVAANFQNGKSFSVNPLNVDRSGNSATVGYTITSNDGSSHTFHLTVVDENGSWKACP